ncbi:MAG: Smr/MutS family protein [Vicinamibacterales bacterium]|nr:Smr/MutS family protein [Vicinamibacterales bacterium]
MKPGDAVQTPFGKGVVREVRNGGRLLVDVKGRALEMRVGELAPLASERYTGGPPSPLRGFGGTSPGGASGHRRRAVSEVDLHGLTVEEALARVDAALNAALLEDLPELRLIHGRSGGRLRTAVHRRLREVPSVRGFRLDPRNDGVTVVSL